MDNRIENLQYGLHSTLWMPGTDVHTPRGSPPPRRSVYSITPQAWMEYI